MARVPITILIPPEVHDRLVYTAMGHSVERCASELLDRWRRRREDDPAPNNAVSYMVAATSEDVPPAEECTVELVVELDTDTAEALERHRFRSLTTAEHAAFLLDRWSAWHLDQAAKSALNTMDIECGETHLH